MGVVGAITPWNFPIYVNTEKVISALLAGYSRQRLLRRGIPIRGRAMGCRCGQKQGRQHGKSA